MILTYFTRLLFLLRWIGKRSRRGHLLEHLEFSSAKVMMRGPIIVHQLCGGRDSETKLLLMRFWFTTSASEVFKASLECRLEVIAAELPLWQLRS